MRVLSFVLLLFSTLVSASDESSLQTQQLDSDVKADVMSLFSRAFLEAKIKREMTETVESDLFKVIEQDPDASEAYVMLLADWNKRKDVPRYLKRLLPIAKSHGESIKLNTVVFSMLLREKRLDEGIDLLENCLAASVEADDLAQNKIDEFNRLVALLAAHYQKTGDLEKGEELFSVIGDKTDPIHHVIASLFYGSMAHDAPDEPVLWVFSSEKERLYEKAVSHINDACDEFGRSHQAVSVLAPAVDALLNLEMKARAESLLLQNLSYKPDDLKSFIMLAKFYDKVNDHDKSFRAWERISHLSLKAEGRFFYNLIKAAIKKKDYEYAEKALINHLKLKSSDDYARYQLGMAYYEQHKYNLAKDEFSRVKKIKHARYMLGITHRQLEQYKKAVVALKEYSALFKARDLDKYYYFTYSLICDKADDEIEREKTFAFLLEHYGAEADVKNFVGYSWADSGVKLAKAYKLIKDAVELEPNVAHLDSLLWVLFKLKRYEEAIDVIKRIEREELDISDAVIYDHFGDVYFAAGDKRKARLYWGKALKVKSDEADFDAIRKKLGM